MSRGNLSDPHLRDAYRMLHARGVTSSTLAAQLGTSRAYVSRMLAGEQRRGGRWVELRRLLTARELELLDKVRFTGRRWSFDNLRGSRRPRHETEKS
ncbi:hypothetical protein [Cerasicoccus arenae]|uniref:Uncharacterized protein n=1 Tax=Cerasicoccus arenae TaxID=424488 RepID=A0A8J3DBT1_9BACT|nr:hypothetical protein [Cerasicoccus arenae]MBK1858218.1 hypothetical protein [Cerasicoccus arenae]GHC01969.1 hypothetical protein GCM10007047_18050 [Cerasicoccus arenae]